MSKQVNTLEQQVSKTREEIIKETHRIEEDALLSSKGHFACSYFWTKFHLWIGIPIVVTASIAGCSFIANNALIGAILSAVVAVLSAIVTFLNPNEKSSAHMHAGNSYEALRNEVRIFRTIDCWTKTDDQLLPDHLKNFSTQKNQLNQSSTQIPWWAYKIARRQISSGAGSYKIDQPPSTETVIDK